MEEAAFEKLKMMKQAMTGRMFFCVASFSYKLFVLFRLFVYMSYSKKIISSQSVINVQKKREEEKEEEKTKEEANEERKK